MPFTLFCWRGSFPCLYFDKVNMFTALCSLILGFWICLSSCLVIILPNILSQSNPKRRLRFTVADYLHLALRDFRSWFIHSHSSKQTSIKQTIRWGFHNIPPQPIPLWNLSITFPPLAFSLETGHQSRGSRLGGAWSLAVPASRVHPRPQSPSQSPQHISKQSYWATVICGPPWGLPNLEVPVTLGTSPVPDLVSEKQELISPTCSRTVHLNMFSILLDSWDPAEFQLLPFKNIHW